MKPVAFDYVVPDSLEAAVAALAAANGDGKAMAGGQSLMPLLNFRMTRPAIVVDLMRIPGLSFIEHRDDTVAIGALTRHADLEFSDVVAKRLPVMAAAMPHRLRDRFSGAGVAYRLGLQGSRAPLRRLRAGLYRRLDRITRWQDRRCQGRRDGGCGYAAASSRSGASAARRERRSGDGCSIRKRRAFLRIAGRRHSRLG
jgi:hypothetical protein